MKNELSFRILGQFDTNISSPDGDLALQDQCKMFPLNFGIPEIEILSIASQIQRTCNTAELHIVDGIKLSYRHKSWGVLLQLPLSKLRGSYSIPYLGYTLNEFQRQEEKHSLVAHGAAVLDTADNKAILLLGNQYSGKTTLLTYLCKNFEGRYKLIGNDMVYMGVQDSLPVVYGGTKFLLVRQISRNLLLPNLGNYTKEKLQIDDPQTVGIGIATVEPSQIKSIIWPRLREPETQSITEIARLTNLADFTLFLAEKISRHITGSCTPIIYNDGSVDMGLNLDNTVTANFRAEISNIILRLPIYRVTGSNYSEISTKLSEIL